MTSDELNRHYTTATDCHDAVVNKARKGNALGAGLAVFFVAVLAVIPRPPNIRTTA